MKNVLVIGLMLLVFPVIVCAGRKHEQLAHLSPAALLERAYEHYDEESLEESVNCFSVLAGKYTESMSREEKECCARACMNLGEILFIREIYALSFTFTFKGIRISEENGFAKLMPRFQNTMGNIYNVYNEKGIAVKYYESALKTAREVNLPGMEIAALKNLAGVCSKMGQTEKAMQYRRKMLELAGDDATARYFGYLSEGYVNEWKNNDDQSRRDFMAAVECSEINGLEAKYTASAYSALAGSFQKAGLRDSAIYYYEKNRIFCTEHHVIYTQKTILQALMGLYKEKGNMADVEKLQREYVILIDSLMKVDEFNASKNDQFIYEINKNFEEISQLTRESELKEAAIKRQKTIMTAAMCVLFFLAVMWCVVYRQKRRINDAYRDLFLRNKELLGQYEELRRLKEENKQLRSVSEKDGASADTMVKGTEVENTGSSVKLSAEQRKGLLRLITDVMENTDEYCQPKFSLEKLSDIVGSNSRYVSQIINETYGKNFRTFVNEFRIREAARRLLDTAVYGHLTIKGIGESVGFKSYANFTETFRKIIGMSPSVYLKMAREDTSKTMENDTDS